VLTGDPWWRSIPITSSTTKKRLKDVERPGSSILEQKDKVSQVGRPEGTVF